MRGLKAEDRHKLEALYQTLLEKRETYIGYPNSQLLDNQDLARFLDLTINNVGDPFLGNNGMHTCEFEQEVLRFFASLFHIEEQDFWGYVTNGGTEGNIYGLYLARENFPSGIVYYSLSTHYSVPKAVRLLGARSMVMRSQRNGEMDYGHFQEMVDSYRQYPVIVNANIGTTMTGAIDDVQRIVEILETLKIRNYYIHCDAALLGPMLPFMAGAPPFDFQLPIASLSISGHKFIGSPIPCGIVLARQSFARTVVGTAEYVGSVNATISGSRDGFSVLILWQTIKRHGRAGFAELVRSCMETREYTLDALKRIGWHAWANPYSNTIALQRPDDFLIQKWQLATQGDMSHLVIVPGVTTTKIDAFIEDLQAARSAWTTAPAVDVLQKAA